MSHKYNILIVEDEAVIRNFLSTILTENSYSVIESKNASQALLLFASHNPDLVLLDLGLPDRDGISVLKEIRKLSPVPVIVVSARQQEKEKIEALDAGADDYITKPFGNGELLARIRTALRRAGFDQQMDSFSLGELQINYQQHLVTFSGKEVHLTPIEFKILSLLSQNSGKVITHENIIKSIWGPYASDSQLLRVNMANIRRKIEKNPADPKYILTEMGVGYKMKGEE